MGGTFFYLDTVQILWLRFVADNVDLSSTTLTYLAPKATEFGEITQNNGYYAVQGYPRSPILVPIESHYVTTC